MHILQYIQNDFKHWIGSVGIFNIYLVGIINILAQKPLKV